MSYFKSFQKASRKSRTTSNVGAKNRAGSQRNNQLRDSNKLHFMPLVENQKVHPGETVKNGWVTKLDKDTESTAANTYTKGQDTESSANKSSRGPLTLKNNEIVFKRNDIKTSSLTRSYRKKYKQEPSPVRYGSLSNRSSGQFRTIKRKRELILFGVGKNKGSNTHLENKFVPKQNSTPSSPLKSRNKFIANANTVNVYNFVNQNEEQPNINQQSKSNLKLSKILNELNAGRAS